MRCSGYMDEEASKPTTHITPCRALADSSSLSSLSLLFQLYATVNVVAITVITPLSSTLLLLSSTVLPWHVMTAASTIGYYRHRCYYCCSRCYCFCRYYCSCISTCTKHFTRCQMASDTSSDDNWYCSIKTIGSNYNDQSISQIILMEVKIALGL